MTLRSSNYELVLPTSVSVLWLAELITALTWTGSLMSHSSTCIETPSTFVNPLTDYLSLLKRGWTSLPTAMRSLSSVTRTEISLRFCAGTIPALFSGTNDWKKEELDWLLRGLNIQSLKPHEKLTFSSAF